MKLRQGFVSNSSSSSFIIQLKKPIEEYSFEEFKLGLQLDKINAKYPYCVDREKGALQLYEAVLNADLTDLPKYKAPNAYQVALGDLCDMEHVETAYELMQDYEGVRTDDFSTVLLANENMAIIDLECRL